MTFVPGQQEATRHRDKLSLFHPQAASGPGNKSSQHLALCAVTLSASQQGSLAPPLLLQGHKEGKQSRSIAGALAWQPLSVG